MELYVCLASSGAADPVPPMLHRFYSPWFEQIQAPQSNQSLPLPAPSVADPDLIFLNLDPGPTLKNADSILRQSRVKLVGVCNTSDIYRYLQHIVLLVWILILA